MSKIVNFLPKLTGCFALPAGLLATGFSDEIKKEKSFCPHCGEKLPSD